MFSDAAATVRLNLEAGLGVSAESFAAVQIPTALAYELSTGGVTKRIPPRSAWKRGSASRSGRAVVPRPKMSYLTSNGVECPPEATSASGPVTAWTLAQFDSASCVRMRSSGYCVVIEATMCGYY